VSSLLRGESRNPNIGWIIGGVAVLAVFVVGAAFWFSYHP